MQTITQDIPWASFAIRPWRTYSTPWVSGVARQLKPNLSRTRYKRAAFPFSEPGKEIGSWSCYLTFLVFWSLPKCGAPLRRWIFGRWNVDLFCYYNRVSTRSAAVASLLLLLSFRGLFRWLCSCKCTVSDRSIVRFALWWPFGSRWKDNRWSLLYMVVYLYFEPFPLPLCCVQNEICQESI